MKNIAIIGGGIGGLTAGALLSKEGYRVTLLEQHSVVGGCATTFKRGDFICEVGLHEMDGVYSNPEIKKIFNKLDLYQNIEFIKVPEFFEIYTKYGSFTMPSELKMAQDSLIEKFPKEKNSILKYFKLIKNISKAFEIAQNFTLKESLVSLSTFYQVLKYRYKTVTEVFNQIFKNEELKIILNANVQYYNDSPNTLSFLLHSIAQYSYYKGGYFIKGGSQLLSNYLASIINKNGGSVVTKANVIECEKESLIYLKRGVKRELKRDLTISNLSPLDTYSLFNIEYQESKEISDSLLTTYIGFSKNLKSMYGKRAYSNFYYNDLSNIDDFNKIVQKDTLDRGFVFTDYSQIDSNLTSNLNKSFGVVCMIDYFRDWEHLSKDSYKKRKREFEEMIVDKLEKRYPNISNLIEYIETATAKTLKRYIKTPNGTAYGFKPTPKQFFKIPKSKSKLVDNLYFVGQWVIAGGFSPAISSGYICYREILKNR